MIITGFDQLKLVLETKNGTDAYFNAYYGGYSKEVRFTGISVGSLSASDFIFDTLNGAGGDDQIFAVAGSDTLIGGKGNDWLYGQAGNDTLIGGAGNDVYC